MSEYISFDLAGIDYTGLNQDGKRPSYIVIHLITVSYAMSDYGPDCELVVLFTYLLVRQLRTVRISRFFCPNLWFLRCSVMLVLYSC